MKRPDISRQAIQSNGGDFLHPSVRGRRARQILEGEKAKRMKKRRIRPRLTPHYASIATISSWSSFSHCNAQQSLVTPCVRRIPAARTIARRQTATSAGFRADDCSMRVASKTVLFE